MQRITDLLIPASGDPPPHAVIVSGLPLTGRRTLLKHALANSMGTHTFVSLHLRSTDSIDVLHLQLLEELGSLDTKQQFLQAREDFQRATLTERTQLLAELFASCCTDGSAVIVLDDGALIDPGGQYTAEAKSLLTALKAQPSAYVGFVHLRRPGISPHELTQLQAVYFRVPPLGAEATKQLLSQQLRNARIEFTDADINELSIYVKGFPPSVEMAVSLIRDKGMGLVKADKRLLVGLQTHTFTELLVSYSLAPPELELLRLLAADLSLPFEGLRVLLEKESSEVAEALSTLVDLSLVQPSESGYSISAPVRFAVQSLSGFLLDSDYQQVVKKLRAEFWTTANEIPSLQVIDTTIQAVLRSGGGNEEFKDFVIPSSLYQAAKTLSDQRGYENLNKARKLLQRLVELDPSHRRGLILLCKVHTRLRDFAKSRAILKTVEQLGYIERYFLTAFILWKERKYSEAITAFRTALAKGVHANEVYHGLGSCLLRLRRLGEAERIVNDGSANRKPNRMLVDLGAQIAIERRDFRKAEELIDQLQLLKADAQFHHRKATLLNAQRKYTEALPHAEKAAADFTRRFEAETVLIDTLIELNRFNKATSYLDDLQRRERDQADRIDILLGLRCKMWLRQGDWRQAESLSKEIADKENEVFARLQRDICELKSTDLTISPAQRAEAKGEFERLKSLVGELSSYGVGDDDSEEDEAVGYSEA